MEEHPEQHDFDQRRDGPEEAANVQFARGTHHDRPSQDQGVQHGSQKQRSASGPQLRTQSMPTHAGDTHSPVSSPTAPPVRHSTQITRNRRPSRDFDVRRDGPFGRPSLTMTRSRSGGIHRTTSGNRVPEVAVEEEEKKVSSDGSGSRPTDEPLPRSSTTEAIPMQSSDPAFEPEPPPLNYTLHTRYKSISIFWFFVILDSVFMPIGLYFGLWYGTNLSPNTVFSIVTAALGGISILEYFLRFWALWKKGSKCRVIGARRMYLDWFHWNFSAAWVIIMIELIVGSIPEDPYIRLLAMPLATMCFTFGTELMLVDLARFYQIPAPLRISSIPKGAQLRPGIYSIIEDVCAVDGGGGTDFRENLNRRYEASHTFRAMLRRLGFFWAVGAQGISVVTTVVVFTTSKDVAYTVGWSLPFVWAGIWTWGTIWYVRRKLREEKTAWAEEVAAKSRA